MVVAAASFATCLVLLSLVPPSSFDVLVCFPAGAVTGSILGIAIAGTWGFGPLEAAAYTLVAGAVTTMCCVRTHSH